MTDQEFIEDAELMEAVLEQLREDGAHKTLETVDELSIYEIVKAHQAVLLRPRKEWFDNLFKTG